MVSSSIRQDSTRISRQGCVCVDGRNWLGGRDLCVCLWIVTGWLDRDSGVCVLNRNWLIRPRFRCVCCRSYNDQQVQKWVHHRSYCVERAPYSFSFYVQSVHNAHAAHARGASESQAQVHRTTSALHCICHLCECLSVCVRERVVHYIGLHHHACLICSVSLFCVCCDVCYVYLCYNIHVPNSLRYISLFLYWKNVNFGVFMCVCVYLCTSLTELRFKSETDLP